MFLVCFVVLGYLMIKIDLWFEADAVFKMVVPSIVTRISIQCSDALSSMLFHGPNTVISEPFFSICPSNCFGKCFCDYISDLFLLFIGIYLIVDAVWLLFNEIPVPLLKKK